MKHLILYSTLGCHLCEQAKELWSASSAASDFTLSEVDIADDEQLMKIYGVRIPVLRDPVDQVELGWPFDGALLAAWLRGLSRQ